MCGISGLIIKERQALPLEEIGDLMNQSLKHRGPDDNGVWIDKDIGLLLNHTRLSINDLSEGGKQPMLSKNKRYIIVFNGEIYNHIELKKEINDLSGDRNWKGHSDTEVLLELIDTWGLKIALDKIIGMFAFGLYDQKLKELYSC